MDLHGNLVQILYPPPASHLESGTLATIFYHLTHSNQMRTDEVSLEMTIAAPECKKRWKHILQSKVVALPVPPTVHKWSYRWDHPMAGRTNVHIGPADPVTIGSTLGHLLCYQPASGTYIWYWFC